MSYFLAQGLKAAMFVSVISMLDSAAPFSTTLKTLILQLFFLFSYGNVLKTDLIFGTAALFNMVDLTSWNFFISLYTKHDN